MSEESEDSEMFDENSINNNIAPVSEHHFSEGDWVAAAIKYRNGRQYRVFYGKIISIDDDGDVNVSFLSFNRYKQLIWPDKADEAIVDRENLLKISPPQEVSNSSTRRGCFVVDDSDIERAMRHFV